MHASDSEGSGLILPLAPHIPKHDCNQPLNIVLGVATKKLGVESKQIKDNTYSVVVILNGL